MQEILPGDPISGIPGGRGWRWRKGRLYKWSDNQVGFGRRNAFHRNILPDLLIYFTFSTLETPLKDHLLAFSTKSVCAYSPSSCNFMKSECKTFLNVMTLVYCYCYSYRHDAGEYDDECGMYGGGEECLQVYGDKFEGKILLRIAGLDRNKILK
jgi:hypothetical protein